MDNSTVTTPDQNANSTETELERRRAEALERCEKRRTMSPDEYDADDAANRAKLAKDTEATLRATLAKAKSDALDHMLAEDDAERAEDMTYVLRSIRDAECLLDELLGLMRPRNIAHGCRPHHLFKDILMVCDHGEVCKTCLAASPCASEVQ